MKKAFSLVLSIVFLIQINQFIIGQSFKNDLSNDVQVIQNSTKIKFNILPKEIRSNRGLGRDEFQLKAEIKHINLDKKDLTLTKVLFVGLERDGDNFIEAFDLKENKIEIERDIHYQIVFDPTFEDPYFQEMYLKSNETKIDTVDLSSFYIFKEKGDFKVRFVNKELNITSNWDTLKVN